MTSFKSSFRAVFLGILLAQFGCAGDESRAGPGAGVDSGLAPDKLLVSLTDQEANVLCEATADALTEIYPLPLQLDAACTLAGVTLALELRPDGTFQLDRAQCERARDQCLDNIEIELEEPPVETKTCELHPMRATTGQACTASVAEYERCVTALLHASAAAIESATCAALAAHPLRERPVMSAPETPVDVPECASFKAKCGAPPSL